jgi:hypothetical protein
LTTQPRFWLKVGHKLTGLISYPDFIAQHRTHPKHFTRQRHLTFRHLILFLLNQPNSALQTELDKFFQALNGSTHETQVVTAQAFSKARQKLSASAFEALNQALHAQMDELGLQKTWQGLRLLAVDGSSMHLPLEDPLARHFGTHNGLPVARVSVLQDLLSEQTLHTLLITPDVDERGCAGMHLDHAPDNSLILFDRGYPAHRLFADLQRRQQHFLMRMKLCHSREVRDFVASGQDDDTVSMTCRHSSSRQVCKQSGIDPDTVLKIRLIRVTLPTGDTEVLATSLLDNEAFPTALFADLYHQRWGIETDYRQLKQTLNLENTSGRTVCAVHQDLHACQLLKNLALLMQALQKPEIECKTANRKLVWKANFTHGMSRLKHTLVTLLVRPCREALENLLALIISSLSAVRPGRRCPRRRKRPATKGCEGYKPTR